MRALLLATAALVAWLAGSLPARAELVELPTGRILSVRAVRSAGDEVILLLRGGGEMVCPRNLIVKVMPDEVEHPEDAVDVPLAPVSARSVPGAFRELIASTASRHGVDARLVHAVVEVESGYRPRAVSPKGARGLMQLLPSTGRQYGALDLFDPSVNLDAGVRHLKSLLRRFELPVALAAYNAGEAAVTRFGGVPPFRETRNYVDRIMRILRRA